MQSNMHVSDITITAPKGNHVRAHVGVLVGGDGYKLGLWEGEALRLGVAAHVLQPVLGHLHDVQPGLVLVQRLQDNHLRDTRQQYLIVQRRIESFTSVVFGD